MLMQPLHRGPERRYVVRQALVVGGQVLRQRGAGAGEVVAGQRGRRGGGHGVAGGVRRERRVEGDGVGDDVVALRGCLRRELGVPVGVRAGGGGLVVQRASQRAVWGRGEGEERGRQR